MLFSEIIAVYSDNHKKGTHSMDKLELRTVKSGATSILFYMYKSECVCVCVCLSVCSRLTP
jgi:hypothetical protein